MLDKNGKTDVVKEAGRKDVPVKNIEPHIVQNAIARNPFFTFRSLKRFFPHLRSLRDFISSEEYLGCLGITFQGDAAELYNVSNNAKLEGLTGLLAQIESEIRQNITEYRGEREFKPNDIGIVFHDKVLKLSEVSERANGDEHFVADKEWYAFNANFGTSEEKAFVRMLDRQIEKLREKYDGIYLIRNERHFKIYSFTDGQAFEPDFVLFLKEKDGNLLTYQLFIEPKGKYLKEYDKWKQQFLKEITDHFGDKVLQFTAKRKYRLVGVPFYNNEDENRFKESLYAVLGN